MEIKDLRIFRSVASEGSISRAAVRLSYVQSYITTRIKALETELDTNLLLRHSRGTTLTSGGVKLLEYTDQILNLVDDVFMEFNERSSPRGSLDIGTVETITRLPDILSAYQMQFPETSLSVDTDVSRNVIEQVLRREIDCGFVTDFNAHPEINKIELLRENLVLISNQPSVTVDTLMHQPMLVFKQGCSYRANLEKWLSDEGAAIGKMKEFGTLETIIGSVKSGLGVSLVPKPAVRHYIEAGEIFSYDLPEKYSNISTDFIWFKNARLSHTMDQFIQTVGEFKSTSSFV